MCIFTAWKALKLKTCTSINSEVPYKKQIALDFSRHIQQDNAVALANANGHQHKFQKELPCTNAKQLPNVNILLGPLSLHFFQQWYTYTYTFKRNLACSLAMTTVPGDDRSAKLRKINDLRAAVPFVSQSSLAAILNFVSKEGLPELKQRGHIREARKNLLDSLSMYGPLLLECPVVDVEGTVTSLLVVNFLTLLAGLFSHCSAFTSYLSELHQRKPSSLEAPWKLLVYTDECHPGNQLSSGARKCWCIYVSFLEYGSFLSKENLWCCILIKRSTAMSSIAAGISQAVKVVLENIFLNPACDPQHTGLLLNSESGSLRLYFTLGGFIQDGAAQRGVWCSRQDSGSRPCNLCANILSLKDWNEDEPVKVLAQYIKTDDLKLVTDSEIADSWERMAGRYGTIKKGDFNMWQQACGMSFSPHALMASTKLKDLSLLKPVSMYGYDWMHTLCSGGVLNYIIFAVLADICEAGMDVWAMLGKFMQFWNLPGSHTASCSLPSLFDNKAVASYKKAGCLKCSASSILSLLKPLQYFIETFCLAKDICKTQCLCLLAWVRVQDFLISLVASSSALDLQKLVETALQLTIDSGYESLFRPKFHWCLHLAGSLQVWGYLPSCFGMERKHKAVRKFGNNICNTANYERSLLEELLREHLAMLDQEDLLDGCHLVNAGAPSKKMAEMLKDAGVLAPNDSCLASRVAKLASGNLCTKGDVVFLRDDPANYLKCGKVQGLFEAGSLPMCLLQTYIFAGFKIKPLATKWTSSGQLLWAPLHTILCSVPFSKGNNGEIICLTPAGITMDG